MICGDLNVARTDADIHPKERKANIIGTRADEHALLERVIAHGLVDVQRTLNPDATDLFTWWAPWRNLRQRNIGWRIDYVLASAALHARTAIVLDPMLATGGSMNSAVALLKSRGATDIRALVLVAAPEGIAALNAAHPDVRCWAAAIDSHLDGNGYIIPGLGDAGDRLFGTR